MTVRVGNKVEVVAINDIAPVSTRTRLLAFDSAFGEAPRRGDP
jgi:glyceraldehyde-3-phosphate dehydrogenase/erythrose-4-phosphate dehydrogenase